MTFIPEDVINAVSACNSEVNALQKEAESEADKARIEYRMKLEALFEQRQAVLDNVDGFWSSVLSAADSPLTPLMNGTTDPKILRAVTGFKVKASANNGSLCRSISITLRSNMFAENGTIMHEINDKLETTSMEHIKWKSGTERARQDSIFRFFTPDCKDHEFLMDALEAFDTVFQNPFLVLEDSA